MRLLQLIPHMAIGGAQTTARILCGIPDSDVTLACYDSAESNSDASWDWLLLHTWCACGDGSKMMVPSKLPKHHRLAVFTHDWRGELRFSPALYFCYSDFARKNTRFDAPAHVVGAGIQTELYSTLPERSLRPLVSVGRLSTLYSGKVSEALLSFWPRINADAFVCAGDGSERESLMSSSLFDSRFSFPGEIPPDHVPQLLHALDIFLYDTVWHVESFCYVILEAMAAGCVVVTRPRGAIGDLIRDGINGFFYERESDCVEICNRLIASPKTRIQVSRAARVAANAYSADSFLRRVGQLLRDG